MNNVRFGRVAAMAVVLAAAVSATAVAQPSPDANISFPGGVNWGSGRMHYQGRRYGLKVSGLSIGAIGATSYDAVGQIYNLRRPSDIEGAYAAVEASATAGGGAGGGGQRKDQSEENKPPHTPNHP